MKFLNRVKVSINDFSKYDEFTKESIGKAIVYILILSLIITVVISLLTLPIALNFYKDLYNDIETKVGDFKVENGELKIDKEMPITIAEFKSGAAKGIFILDTTGETTPATLFDYNMYYLITDKYVYGPNNIKINFSHFEGFSNNSLYSVIILSAVIVSFFQVIALFIVKFFGNLFVILVVSFVMVSLNRISFIDMGFKEVYKVGIYAITLPMLLKALFDIVSKYMLQTPNGAVWTKYESIAPFVGILILLIFMHRICSTTGDKESQV